MIHWKAGSVIKKSRHRFEGQIWGFLIPTKLFVPYQIILTKNMSWEGRIRVNSIWVDFVSTSNDPQFHNLGEAAGTSYLTAWQFSKGGETKASFPGRETCWHSPIQCFRPGFPWFMDIPINHHKPQKKFQTTTGGLTTKNVCNTDWFYTGGGWVPCQVVNKKGGVMPALTIVQATIFYGFFGCIW